MRPEPVGSMSFRIAFPAVDLPQPLSPTRPRVSPGAMSKLMPSTVDVADDAREHALVHREMLLEPFDLQ
jgi:hypothetical protein